MDKVSAIAAAQAEPTTSSSPLDAYDELQQVIEEDEHAQHMQDEENDGSTYELDEVRSSKRTAVVKARSAEAAATTTTAHKAKPAPKTKAKAKPARKISPTECPPPAKRRKSSGAGTSLSRRNADLDTFVVSGK